MSKSVVPAERISKVEEYYFSIKLKEIAKMNAEGAGVINLGIGSPDMPPTLKVREMLAKSAMEENVHGYQPYVGIPQLREAFAAWYRRYYSVELDPSNEILPLMGSKEGVMHISMAFVNPGDKVLVPDPGYPTYTSASKLVGAEIVTYDLTEENHWWPDFDALERMDLEGVKIMWTNYPNMPTGAKATPELYQKLVDFGRKHRILIVNDNPYSFILCGKPLSILAAKGSEECCLELNSLSKAHNMSGWRIGMVGGAPEYIAEVLKVKSQMDSGMFKPLQLAAVEALNQSPEWFEELNSEYVRRRVAAGRIFKTLGAVYDHDTAGLFLWGRVPSEYAGNGMTAGEVLSERILRQAGVFITPGFIFGKNGNDYIRISLCAKPEVLERANKKIERVIKNIL